jgi:hypothetical protein
MKKKECGGMQLCHNLRHYPNVLVEELREITTDLYGNSPCSG